jgi:DUF4097 and DUF4098 domain-containing protein YvlB
MASLRPRSSNIFVGIVLIAVGVLLLLHNYRGYEIGGTVLRWSPLILIIWGVVKLYERTASQREGGPPSRTTAGEVFLMLGLLALLGVVIGVDYAKQNLSGVINDDFAGDSHDYDLNVSPAPVPADAHIVIRNGRGDITVRPADTPEVHVTGKATIRTWSDDEADRIAKPIGVEVVRSGDGYEVHPSGFDTSNGRISVDMAVSVPRQSTVTIRSDRGDIVVSGMSTPVTVNSAGRGDIEVRDTNGDVSIENHKGDIRVSDTKGDVSISGHGGDVDVSNTSGRLTLNGEFFGSIRADKIAKGVRFISNRTDLTLTQLSGHLDAGSGNLEIADAPGDLALRTNRYDVSIENPGGRVRIDNRDGNISVRFSSPPKDDIEITNSSGGISLSIPGNSNFEITADCREGDIESEFDAPTLKSSSTNGNSHLEGKVGSGRGPRITLRTTYKSITLSKTS